MHMALQAWGQRMYAIVVTALWHARSHITHMHIHMHAHLRVHMTRIYVMALQAWVAAKRTRDFDEADRIREAMLAAGMRIMSK